MDEADEELELEDGALASAEPQRIVLRSARHLGERLDKTLADLADVLQRSSQGPALSRSRIQALIREGRVRRDGAPVTDPAARFDDASYEIEIPPPVAAEPGPEAIPLAVLFEDAHLIVVDKPAGMAVHPAPGSETGTLVNALLAHCGASLSGIGGVARPGIVHRLDKDTSGLLVVAKTDQAHRALAKQFADHGRTGVLERGYLALVWGAPSRPHGTIDAPVGRHPASRQRGIDAAGQI